MGGAFEPACGWVWLAFGGRLRMGDGPQAWGSAARPPARFAAPAETLPWQAREQVNRAPAKGATPAGGESGGRHGPGPQRTPEPSST